MKRLAACVLAVALGCAATPTSLTVRAVFPEGEPITAPYLDVTITDAAGAGRKVIYERSTLDPGDQDQTLVVVLDQPAVGQTLEVLVEARDATSTADGGAATSRIVASGAGSVTILADQANALTVPLTLR